MDDSFFYFFSTVPQVLGAVIGLFGIFVLFKIQILKEEIIEVSKDLKNSIDISAAEETSNMRKDAHILLDRSIQIKNITVLKTFFNNDYARFQQHFNNQALILSNGLVGKFNNLHLTYKTIVISTIVLSCLSGILIVACLAALPSKCLLMSKSNLLFWIYRLVTGSIGIIFFGLIMILIISLSSSFRNTSTKRSIL